MGAGNALQSYLRWASLPDVAKLVLLRMALTALDNDDPPRYFGGWEILAQAIGRELPPITDEMSESDRRDRDRSREAARRAVGRAVRILVDAGAVDRLNSPQAGRRADYRLNL